MIHETEVHAYVHILAELKTKKGWRKEQIFTQNEIQRISEIKKQLKLKTPENIVKVKENLYYVIESKSKRNMINNAINEATCYADKINQSKSIKALFITGIAGNDNEGYDAGSRFFHNGKWDDITENNVLVASLLSTSQTERILEVKDSKLKDVEISEDVFFNTAEDINNILHENAIHKDYRARFISALLLALSDESKIDTDQEPLVLVDSINSKVDLILKKHKKGEFSRFIHIDKPANTDNHIKLKTAIVDTTQELLSLNIQSAMRSGKDVLGRFYEVFLKYGNGAKEIGIVLTPRHITKFAVDVLDVNENDLVLDPTCGTGGFLVSAFDKVCKNSNIKTFNNFKNYGLYGIEEQDQIVALALVNMIFRGDGKTNIIEGDCFAKHLDVKTVDGNPTAVYLKENKENRIRPITKVLMNPPFPKNKTDQKEYLFIEYALDQMQNDGLLFCVVPYPCLVKSGHYEKWRKRMLKNHTLLSIITFPEDLFYPILVHTAGLILKKGTPHNKEQNVFWLRGTNDGLVKSKGKRIHSDLEPDIFTNTQDQIKQFISDPTVKINNISGIQKICPIDYEDKLLELVPEAYVDEDEISIEKIETGLDKLVRESLAFVIEHKKEIDFLDEQILDKLVLSTNKKKIKHNTTYKAFSIPDLFKVITKGDFHVSSLLDQGKIPFISCITSKNGITGQFDIDPKNVFEKCITIASDGSPLTSYYHPYKFNGQDNVIFCKPKDEINNLSLIYYILFRLKSQKWRFSYGRKCYYNKIDKIKIKLPIKNNEIDRKNISQLLENCYGWNFIEKTFSK